MTQPPAPPSDDPRLQKAKTDIKNAWIAGAISGVITLVFALIAMSSAEIRQNMGIDAWLWIDVVLIFGLTFGIYKKSRICAVLMFVYFAISKLIQFSSGQFGGAFVAVLFLYFYFQGMRGTFTYHKLKQEQQQV